VSYNPNILTQVLSSRALTTAKLSKRLGIDKQELDRELGLSEPRQGLLNDIARELAVPIFTFYMERAPNLNDRIPDFRSTETKLVAKERQTLVSIQLARAIQARAEELHPDHRSALPPLQQGAPIGPQASAIRKWFGISIADQIEAKDSRVFYNICRRKIEAAGIFVLQDSFPDDDGSGFCLASANAPVILVNTKRQTRGRRLFTLMHELAHALLGETGISDPFARSNPVEKFCNAFAGHFLVPTESLTELLAGLRIPRSPDRDDVASIARKLKISQQATILRLERMGLVSSGSYASWLRIIAGVNPDFKKEGGGASGPPPQEKVKLARYGFYFASMFGRALDEGSINDLQLYRASGLKPKYQRNYISFAASLSDTDVSGLELGDE
jgi:Zn-dependent peptidase ImmA (M78 family)